MEQNPKVILPDNSELLILEQLDNIESTVRRSEPRARFGETDTWVKTLTTDSSRRVALAVRRVQPVVDRRPS